MSAPPPYLPSVDFRHGLGTAHPAPGLEGLRNPFGFPVAQAPGGPIRLVHASDVIFAAPGRRPVPPPGPALSMDVADARFRGQSSLSYGPRPPSSHVTIAHLPPIYRGGRRRKNTEGASQIYG
jgi:hypothetical protein